MPCSLVSYVTVCRRSILSESSTQKTQAVGFYKTVVLSAKLRGATSQNDVMFKLYLKLKFLIQENTLPCHYKIQLINSH
jgi:hypothetical protein